MCKVLLETVRLFVHLAIDRKHMLSIYDLADVIAKDCLLEKLSSDVCTWIWKHGGLSDISVNSSSV